MALKLEIGNLHCLCSNAINAGRIAYILYPVDDCLDNWIDPAAGRYGTTIVMITGMDWQNVFSPWPADGIPAGTPGFKGEAREFLHTLRHDVIPGIETALGCSDCPERTLVGVSMSGLFALWQWFVCDTFANIASLSGSFWYQGLMAWIKSHMGLHKGGHAFFLLGNQEAKSGVKAFQSVGANTTAIVDLLKNDGIQVQFMSVPGNHYSNPVPRLDAAFSAIHSWS